MPIPTFSIQAPINAADARHDKIELLMPLGCIQLQNYTGQSAEDFLPFQQAVWDRLVGPPQNAEDALSLINNGVQSRVFGRGSNKTKISVNTRVRSGLGPGPLLNGHLILKWRQSPRFQVELKFQGYLNLTRYVRHQGLGDRSALLENPQELQESLFRFSPNADGKSHDEFSLDGSDNWLPGAARWNPFLRQWHQLKEQYLAAVQHMLHSEIDRVCEFMNVTGNPVTWHPHQLAGWINASLQKVETYWEFLHPAPTELVKSLESELRSYCASQVVCQEFHGREERQGSLQRTATKNCLSLEATLAPGIFLVIYAKTNKRVRFEVRHYLPKLTNRRGILQECASMNDVENRIGRVTNDAARMLNDFFGFLRSRVTFVPFSHSPLNLLFLCAQCAELPAYGDAVANLLISNGQVTRLPALAKTIKALERANVLERVNNEQGTASEAFLVTPQYRHALEVLQAINTTQQVTGPMRRRQRVRAPITRPSP